jgi:hypothetical protein
MTQGKRKDQINFSSRMAFIGFIGVTLCFIWAMSFLPEPLPPTKGIPHNYYVPTVWEHDTIIPEDTTNNKVVTWCWPYNSEVALDSFVVHWSTKSDSNGNGRIDFTNELYVTDNLSDDYLRWKKWLNNKK